MTQRVSKMVFSTSLSAALLLWASQAHAYLDPATGSIILQGLLAGVAGVMVVLRLHWAKVKGFFRRLRGGASPVERTPGSEPPASGAS